jgi:hypothetical protein
MLSTATRDPQPVLDVEDTSLSALPPGCAGGKKKFKKPSMRAGRAVDSDEAANALSLFEDVDLSCLHRCLHVQKMLGDSDV